MPFRQRADPRVAPRAGAGRLSGALADFDRTLPVSVPVLIGGAGATARSCCVDRPGAPARVVARRPRPAEARSPPRSRRPRRAASGRAVPAAERAAALLGRPPGCASAELELAALEVRECAKPWPEADADVCEAIDFLEYYARGAIELERGRELLQVPGERNELRYVPRGVVAVIAPWNFPLAIPCGMTAAALATGNAVVLKPAEQSPGWRSCSWRRCGPAACPTRRSPCCRARATPARRWCAIPRVHVIAFTGSLPVGRSIVAGRRAEPGERHFKQVVAELGGKNCVIVDADADLDEAVPAIVASAFAFAGQKCSAASRVLVEEAIAEQLSRGWPARSPCCRSARPRRSETDVPPVIERAAQERVARYRELAAADGRIAAGAPPDDADGWFCPATVVGDLPDDSPVLDEEIFGPLLAVQRVRDVEHACEIVDGLSVRAHRRAVLPRPADDAPCQRTHPSRQPLRQPRDHRCDGRTPAVRRQPPVGDRPKAGGPDYLLHFVAQRALSREHDAPWARRIGARPAVRSRAEPGQQ